MVGWVVRASPSTSGGTSFGVGVVRVEWTSSPGEERSGDGGEAGGQGGRTEEGGGGRGTRWWTANPNELLLLKHLVGRRWEHAGVEGFERTGG